MHLGIAPWLTPLILAGVLAGPATEAAEPVTPDLTPKLDRLLREEMQGIQGAMHAVHTGIVTGDHTAVAEKAQAIHDSFILKRELTNADRRDLKAAVPKRFLEMDQRFHKQAADLAEAARSGRTGRELALFQRMTRTCVQCHADFAGDRFPAVGQPGQGG